MSDFFRLEMIPESEMKQIVAKLRTVLRFTRRPKDFWSVTDQVQWTKLLLDHPLFKPSCISRYYHHNGRDCLCDRNPCECYDFVYLDGCGGGDTKIWRLE